MNTEAAPLWKQLRDRRASADEVLRLFDISVPHVDVESIVKRLGIGLDYVAAQEWAGTCSVEGNTARILIRRNDSDVRRRFTIAHELGHIVVHRETESFRDISFSGDAREIQANNFAAALLMPKWMVLPYARVHGMNVEKLAEIFRVSRPAMEIRLAALALRG